MMKITVLGSPPTATEIETAQKYHLTFAVYLYTFIRLTGLLAFGVFVNLAFSPIDSFWMFWLCASIAVGLFTNMIGVDTNLRARYFFRPISKYKCAELAPLLEQPEVAEYCRKVAEQGRLLIEAEYAAIIEHNKTKRQRVFEQTVDHACKKVYSLERGAL